MAKADGTVEDPDDPTAVPPVYTRPLGFGFIIVVEGRKGGDNRNVGTLSFNYDPEDPNTQPDLQIIVDRPLGNGSRAVCDNTPPEFGGVPAVNPPSFSPTQPISDAMNDFGCRFVNGQGEPVARKGTEACTVPPDGEAKFVSSQSQVQYCATLSLPLAFKKGETLVSVRLLDDAGTPGEVKTLIIRSLS